MKKALSNFIAGIFLTLQAGLTRACGPRSGGIATLYLVDASDVTSFTKVGTTWTAVTMVGAAVFKKFEFEQDTAMFKWDGGVENGSTKVDHTIEAYFGKMTQTNRDRMQDILDSSVCGVIAIVVDNNSGQKWVLGYSSNFTKDRPLRKSTVAGDSGKVFTDQNGQTLTLMSTDNELPCTFSGSIPT